MSTLKANLITKVDGSIYYNTTTPVQTVVYRSTNQIATSSSADSLFLSGTITTKTVNPTILCFIHVKQRVDIGGWNLAYFRVTVAPTSTQIVYSGYNGAYCSGWIHDYTTEKPYYATAAAGTLFTFNLYVSAYPNGGTNYFNYPSQSADDGYAIMKLTELGQ